MTLTPLILALWTELCVNALGFKGPGTSEETTDSGTIRVRVWVSRSAFTVNRKVHYVSEGSLVTLLCDPDKEIKSGIRSISWVYDGATSKTDTTCDYPTEVEDTFTRQLVAENEGSYNCLVNTSKGTLLSETIVLKIAVLTQIPVVHYWHDIIRDPYLLPCDVTKYFIPRGEVTWFKDKKEVQGATNLYIDIDGALNFLYLTAADFGKPYYCKVHSRKLQQTIVGNTTFVLKDAWTHRVNRKPVLISSTETASAAEGDDVTLECSFGGDPEPTVTWTRKYNHEARHKYSSPETKGKQLRIANVSVSDGGSYTCTAKNPSGEAESAIQLHVKKTPALAKPIESRVLLTGTSVTYHCAPEDGHLESRWFVDGWPQAEGTEKLFFGKNKKSLTITSTRNDRAGLCVQCNVSNDIAYTLYSACVRYEDSTSDPPVTTAAVPTAVKLWTVLVPVALVIIAGIFIIISYIGVRRRTRGLPTVETELPTTPTLYLEAHQLIEQRISHLHKKQEDGQRDGTI
ncbi:hemicentin-2-like [Haliotis rufescens]|uniref:hemicentin-2-like n=1 Tax=Haliotis rufescens TaxID=6454 RepID=UPI00201F0697|nr:hemicentin-2-like [Haliotis rufescens]